MLKIHRVIEKANVEAYKTVLDQYLISDTQRNIIAFKAYSGLSNKDWVIGKISLVFKDKQLKTKFIEYPNLIRFVCMYKGIQIIEIIFANKKQYSFTILKNRNANNPNILFDNINEVKEYISSFDMFTEKDRLWFLAK